MKQETKQDTSIIDLSSEINFMEDAMIDKGISAEDCTIPRLSIIQSGSPQCKRGTAKYDEKAKEGDLYDSVNKSFISGDKGLKVVPVTFSISFLEWMPRDAGGGLVANHGNNPAVLQNTTKNEKGKDVLPNGNIISLTHEYYVLSLKEDGTTTPYVISMSSSQLKVSKNWNTVISLAKRPLPNGKEGQMFNPAMFFTSYELTTIPETNKNNDSYMNYAIKVSDDVITLKNGVSIYGEASRMAKAIKGGEVKTQEHESLSGEANPF